MEPEEIRTLVTRIARRNKKGGATVERATLLAEGSDVEAIEAWIVGAGGTPESAVVASGGGLHAARDNARDAARMSPPVRYVLPPGALDG